MVPTKVMFPNSDQENSIDRIDAITTEHDVNAEFNRLVEPIADELSQVVDKVETPVDSHKIQQDAVENARATESYKQLFTSETARQITVTLCAYRKIMLSNSASGEK